MELFELTAPCHFGLEAVLKREILDLGYEILQVEDGRVTFSGDAEAVAYANLFLRTADRILLKVGRFEARTFEELFERTKDLPWERYIPKNGKFWVAKANSIRSKLFSPSDIQSIMKKSHGRAAEKPVSSGMVSGGRGGLPDPGVHCQRPGSGGAGYHRNPPSQERIPGDDFQSPYF